MNPALAAAVDVFRTLGWDRATLDDAETLPLGTPEQQRVARAGLAKGEWGAWGHLDGNTYGWISGIDVDRTMLAVFAVRVGVDAKRSAALLPGTQAVDDERATRLLAARGPAFAEQFVEAACRADRRLWEHSTSVHAGAVVRLVDLHDLPVPASVEYLRDWAVYAQGALTGEGELFPRERGWCPPEVVTRRLPEHVRQAVALGVPATGPFGAVVPAAVEQGLLDHDEAVTLVLAALDSAQRPGDRKAWAQVLTGPLGVTGDALVPHADALVPALAHGDSAVVEAIAPALVAGVDDDLLADVLTVSLLVRTKKVLRLLLAEAARRPRPSDDVVAAVAPLVLPHAGGTDRTLARAATALVDAWGVAADPDHAAGDAPVGGLWQDPPPVWDVPRLDVGEPSAAALTAAAATLTGRPDGVVDVEVERFLALANAVAHADVAAARTALGGVRTSWVAGLRCVPSWVAGEPSPLADRPADPERWNASPLIWDVLHAREASVVARLGAAPVLLSTPTWVDLRIDPADLVERLRAYADAGATAAEADLFLAMLRADGALVTDDVLAALDALPVPVVLQDGTDAGVTAGPALRRHLTDPVREPALEIDPQWRRWTPATPAVPASLEAFPRRVGANRYAHPGFETFPTWGDAAGRAVGAAEDAASGLVLRQAVRRATPLPPGTAVNLLGAQRGFHAVAAPDGTTAVMEAWERGLLRPGVPDVRLLDWAETPSNLAALARALRELADEGLLAVVWPVLDDVVAASLRAPRMLAGTADVAEAVQALLPEVEAAVAAGVADAGVLALPGVRALAGRGGSSRAVVAARAVVARLPEPVTAPEAETPAAAAGEPAATAPASATTRPTRAFAEVWPDGAGTLPAVVDGAAITAVWDDPDASSRMLAVDLDVPGAVGGPFRVTKGWFYDLEREGQCAARSAAARAAGANHHGHDVWLHWDAAAGRLVVSPHRDWRTGADGPLTGGDVPPLTTSMAAVVLASLCHDDAAVWSVQTVVREGLLGSAAVTVAVRALLPHPDVTPARMMKLLESDPTTLPVLWPVLVEPVRHAAGLDGPAPRWLNRVLDVALLHAPLLREAADRGLLPADAAAWPGLRDLAERGGSPTVRRKARTLVEQVLPG
jgi:hypothetical protein